MPPTGLQARRAKRGAHGWYFTYNGKAVSIPEDRAARAPSIAYSTIAQREAVIETAKTSMTSSSAAEEINELAKRTEAPRSTPKVF
jgi:hypothetical protein